MRYLITPGFLDEAVTYGHISKSAAYSIRTNPLPKGARILTREQIERAMLDRGCTEEQTRQLVQYFFDRGGQGG